MRRRHIGRVCLAGICLASILVLLAIAVSGCGEGAPATTASVDTPVSARDDRTLWLGTTSTGSGPVDLYCSVTFTASQPRDPVAVSLFNGAGEFIDSREGMPYEFKGLQPGKYRLGVFGVSTGYISQWYGGLPAQGHDVSESQVLDLQPGRNVAEFALQPGLSIRGEVSWTQGTRVSGDILVYDLQRRDTRRRGRDSPRLLRNRRPRLASGSAQTARCSTVHRTVSLTLAPSRVRNPFPSEAGAWCVSRT